MCSREGGRGKTNVGTTVERSVLNRCFPGLNPITYGEEQCEPSHSYGYASREYYLIHYVISGKGIFARGGKTHALYRGCLFLIRPGELTFYQADEKNPWEYVWIGFDGSLCPELLEAAGFSDGVCWKEASQLAGAFEELRAVPDRQPSTELTLCSLLYEIFGILCAQDASPRTPRDYVARTADYIRANYALPVNIESIASMLGIDRRYLSRIFLREMGETPKEFLVRVRLNRAAELLKTSACTVTETARSVGYDDVYNFSKIFKKKYGISPAYFRKAAADRDQKE